MSTIQLLPTDVLVEIFCYIQPSEIATNCRSVCKSWNAATYTSSLWQKIAVPLDIGMSDEISVRNWLLKRQISVSTTQKFEKVVTDYFLNIHIGGTGALCYLSVSKQDAIGFFIRTEDSKFTEKVVKADCPTIADCQDFFSQHARGLTIIGKDEADYTKNVICDSSSGGFLGVGECSSVQGINHICMSFCRKAIAIPFTKQL